MDKLRLDTLKTTLESLKHIPNVVGGGLGKRIKNNQITDEDVIHILVIKKLPEQTLDTNLVIPKEVTTSSNRSIPIDIIQVGHLRPLTNRDLHRPVIGGISIANVNTTATGTLSGVFRDKSSNKPVILSNNHVMARENAAIIGERIEQPSQYEDIPGRGAIASLTRFVTISSRSNNQVDGAVADLLTGITYDINVSNIGFIRSVITNPPINKLVQKSGRSSEKSIGAIISTHVTVTVGYDFGSAIFENQILTTSMLIPGDSGSLLMSLKGELIGLGFAGSDDTSVYNPIDAVFRQLNIENYQLSTVQGYKNTSRGGFFFRTNDDPTIDPSFNLGLGNSFFLYPKELAIPNTALLKRWKTKTYPYQYALNKTAPSSNFSEHSVLGRIRLTQQDDTLALREWLNSSNGFRYYSTNVSENMPGFVLQPNIIGYVSKIENIQFSI